MKKQITAFICLCSLLCSLPVSAMEYRFEVADARLFGWPTSDETIQVAAEETTNIDRSKNAAYLPPVFGSPTSNVRNSGELLTPNLVSRSTTDNIQSRSGGVTVLPTASSTFRTDADFSASTRFTDVTTDLIQQDGSLGTLQIPAIGLTVQVYQGTDSTTLKKGAGHFPETSLWAGNVAIAAHNRGTNGYFGRIHTLETGDRITLTTELGTRIYAVASVRKVQETDTSMLEATSENCLTLLTCVRNVPDSRWCVRAVEL